MEMIKLSIGSRLKPALYKGFFTFIIPYLARLRGGLPLVQATDTAALYTDCLAASIDGVDIFVPSIESASL